MTLDCGFDGAIPNRPNSLVYTYGWSSDCHIKCHENGCDMVNQLGQGGCDDACNNAACGWDNQECGVCNSGCHANMLGNGNCDSACESVNCNWDNGDCGYCAPGCTYAKIETYSCHSECFNMQCVNWSF